jgi:hypothetical protein
MGESEQNADVVFVGHLVLTLTRPCFSYQKHLIYQAYFLPHFCGNRLFHLLESINVPELNMLRVSTFRKAKTVNF